MTQKAKIKVIKKGAPAAPSKSVEIENKSAPETAREIVSTVTNWVNDFQQRQREETKQAIEKFPPPKPQPNGV